MANYTWGIDTLPISTDQDRVKIVETLDAREAGGWDLVQTAIPANKIMFFWRSKVKT